MPNDMQVLPPPASLQPTARGGAAKEQPERPAAAPSAPEKPTQSPRRGLVRWALFALLPLALLAGGYWYVTGGQVMSTDDAYVEADKVGVSTDVSGIVKEVDVTENQHVEAGRVLYRLDDLAVSARAGPRQGAGRHGRATTLNALKANYRDMQTQIQQGNTTSNITAPNSTVSRPC